MQEKVDILLATYNTDTKFLKQQIESILNQTHKNVRLIIGDDNSNKKDVKKILLEFSKKDERIELYIQDNNIGYIKNFEFLLQKSSAEYVMFADHDDVWYPEKVEKSLKELKENNVDLVYVNAEQINENGNVIQKDYFSYKNMPLVKGKNKLAISRCIGIGCSQIFTKDIVRKMLPYQESVIAQDWLAAFIANENKGIAYIQEPLFGYRLHETNIFGGRNLNQNLARWKEENGSSYKSYLKYRKEKVIDKAYLNGAKMCLDYSREDRNEEFLKEIINYYKSIKKSKYFNCHMIKYFKFLGGRNLLKKMIKEIVIFHFPLLGYIKFKMG